MAKVLFFAFIFVIFVQSFAYPQDQSFDHDKIDRFQEVSRFQELTPKDVSKVMLKDMMTGMTAFGIDGNNRHNNKKRSAEDDSMVSSETVETV